MLNLSDIIFLQTAHHKPALFRGNAQVNLILIGRRAGSAALYCYVTNSVTNLVTVVDNVVGLVR